MTSGHSAVAVGLALLAAACFAVSNVTQMDAVSRQPASRPVDAGVLVRVARDPLWLIGLVASILGFGLEATALAIAPVVLVQPLIVAELPFALPLAARVAGRHLGRQEWTGIGLVSAGLAGVVIVIRPEDAPIRAGATMWVTLFAVVALVAAGLVAAGHRAGPVGRTSALAAAAGAVFGLLSVVTKATSSRFEAHGLAALAGWEPWALAVVGLAGMTLAQNAYRAGPLAVSLPLLDIGEPAAGSAIAVAVFGERLGPLGTAGAGVLVLALTAVLAGVAVLDRSPLVQAAEAASADRPGNQAPAVTKSISDSTAPTSEGSRSA